MKGFFVIPCLFSAMLLAIFANCFYIEGFAKDAISVCEQIPPFSPSASALEKIADIQTKWKENKKFIQITVNHTEIELIDNAVDELLVYARGESAEEFEKARQLAINAFEELRLSEHLTFTNVL